MLLTQLTLGFWFLLPLHAAPSPPPSTTPARAPAATRPSAVRAKAPAERRGPTPGEPRRAVAPKAPPARAQTRPRPEPAARKATPAPRESTTETSSNTAVLKQLPHQPNPNVRVITLGNGVLGWCRGKADWQVVEVRVAIAAGSANDPKGLFGRSRFLAHLLRKQLNQPKNPAQSLFPPGGQRYRVTLDKIWVEIRVRSTHTQLPMVLAHIANTLNTFHKQPLTTLVRGELEKTAGSFPPPQLPERIDAYLFGEQPRGALLRGKKRTFRSIQPLTLQTAYEKLYSPNRMRVLVVGNVDCQQVETTMQKTWMALPRGKDTTLYPSTTLSTSGQARSLLASQQLFSLYHLPDLHRHGYIPLQILRYIALKELRYQMIQKFGAPFPIHSFLEPAAQNGYLVVAIPANPLSRGQLQQHLKQTLGRLQMKRYLPDLEQRVQMYLREVRMKFQQMKESSAGTADLLWPQLLLPPHSEQAATRPPSQIQPILKALNPSTIRELALLFMSRDFSLNGMARPFSMQRIALFIGTIILVWLLLDIILRRTRRPEE